MTRTLAEWRRIQREGRNHRPHRRKNINLMEAQSRIARFIDDNEFEYDEQTFVNNLRGEIVHVSHDVWISNGARSHKIRQRIRRALWDYSKRKFREDNSEIDLDEYRSPHEVKGIIKSIVNKFFKK
ncbi:MAG: hypothetical protein KGH60_03775 [Candidatus Micrarchaeota archaeon]|nr:hypothetical protein [Candidatus Micrarchaeota archaeon]